MHTIDFFSYVFGFCFLFFRTTNFGSVFTLHCFCHWEMLFTRIRKGRRYNKLCTVFITWHMCITRFLIRLGGCISNDFSSCKQIPVVNYIFRNSLKLKASDAESVWCFLLLFWIISWFFKLSKCGLYVYSCNIL